MTSRKKPAAKKMTAPPKPGSRGFNDGSGFPGVPDVYTDENIAEREAAAEAAGLAPSGVKVLTDQWYGQIEEGNPFQDTAKPYVDGNPDRHFRFLSKRNKRGNRGYQQVIDPETGKAVEVSGMPLGWIPKTEAERRATANVERSNQAVKAAREEFQHQAERIAREEPGLQPLRSGEIVGEIPIGVDARRGSLASS